MKKIDPTKKLEQILSSVDQEDLKKKVQNIAKNGGEKLKKQLDNIDKEKVLELFNKLDPNEVKQKLKNLDLSKLNINDASHAETLKKMKKDK